VHVYSAAVLRERYAAFDAPFAGVPHAVHYALKANSTLAIVRLMRALGARADANSWGEIEVARRAGFAPAEIVFTGVGKTIDELRQALTLGVHTINAESVSEVDRIDVLARDLRLRARVALRVNPDIDAESHPHISTGLRSTKFGMSMDDARHIARACGTRPGIRLLGLHMHIGSQITKAAPLAQAAAMLARLARECADEGVVLDHLDIGGGLGIAYRPDAPALTPAAYADAVLPALREVGLPLILEPGRWLAAPAGCLLARVVDMKADGRDRTFVVVDAGMTDLLRPALYGAWHAIEPVTSRTGASRSCDIVGPVCETTDTIGLARTLPPLAVGDLLLVRDTGAYGAVMASNYNRRPLAAEVLVEGQSWRVIRRRQTVDDMLQWDL
jgi:diaminopimelate decarboxylase